MNEKDIDDILASSSDSKSGSNEGGHSNNNLVQLQESFACASLSEERINSCSDYSSESCSSVSEHSTKSLTLHEESTPCTSLSDEQLNSCSKYSATVSNHSTSENDVYSPVTDTRHSCHESATSRGPSHRATSRGPSHRETLRGPSHRATSRGPSHRATSRGPRHRATSRGPSHRETSRGPSHRETSRGPSHRATSRGPSHRETSRVPAVQHYTSLKTVVPYYEDAPVPYYQAASVSYYQAASLPCFQEVSVPCSRSSAKRCCRSCAISCCCSCQLQCCRSSAGPCCRPSTGPCCRSSAGPCCRSSAGPCCRSSAAPCCRSSAGPCCRSSAGPCCRSSAGPCCRSSTYPYYLMAGNTASYQQTEIPSYQTASAPRYQAGTFRRSRRVSFSSPRVCLEPESKINPRRGVVAFPRRRRGRHPMHRGCRALANNRETRTTFDRLDVAGPSHNKVHKCLQFTGEEPEQSHFNRQQLTRRIQNRRNESCKKCFAFTNSSDGIGSNNNDNCSCINTYSNGDLVLLSDVGRSSNEEKDNKAFESNINNLFHISDSDSCDYAHSSNIKINLSNISDFPYNKKEITRNTQQCQSKNGGISKTEFSDSKSGNGSIDCISMLKDILSVELPSSPLSPIYSNPRLLESSPRRVCRTSSETSDIISETLVCIDLKFSFLKDLIALSECNVSETLGNSDSSCETFASDTSQKGFIDSYLDSRIGIEKEYFYESCRNQSTASNTLDEYELHRHFYLASPISVVQKFCIALKSKCEWHATTLNKLLSKSTEFTSSVESRVHQICIHGHSLKMQTLKVVIRHLRKWCDLYYDYITKIFSKKRIQNLNLGEYWEFRIRALGQSLKLLDELPDLDQIMQA